VRIGGLPKHRRGAVDDGILPTLYRMTGLATSVSSVSAVLLGFTFSALVTELHRGLCKTYRLERNSAVRTRVFLVAVRQEDCFLRINRSRERIRGVIAASNSMNSARNFHLSQLRSIVSVNLFNKIRGKRGVVSGCGARLVILLSIDKLTRPCDWFLVNRRGIGCELLFKH